VLLGGVAAAVTFVVGQAIGGRRLVTILAPEPRSGAVQHIRPSAGVEGESTDRGRAQEPGDQYRQTRHNVGWMVLDRLADRAGWGGKGRSRDASTIVGGRFRSLDLLLVKPQTYMNESGIAVRKVLARERAPLTEMLVVVDDFSLPFGKLRFREGGGPGGHNGLRSIIGELESEAFSRLRVGIGAPNDRFIDHVLTKFETDERHGSMSC
jgi:PTH1 family peptidyl-tRNA hydrolase